jgi:hypothetical protein
METLVDQFLFEIALIPLDRDDAEWDGALDEESYARSQLEYCNLLSVGKGNIVYNALLFYAHGEMGPAFDATWIKQHTDARLVLMSAGSGYYIVMLNTLLATLRLLDRICCQAHPFYRETGRQNRILPTPEFAAKVRPWYPVWCVNDLFVRFAAVDDAMMEYPVTYSDYDPTGSFTAAASSVPPPVAVSPTNAQSSAEDWPNGPGRESEQALNGQIEGIRSTEEAVGEDGLPRKKVKKDKTKLMTPQERFDAKRIKEANKGLSPGWKAFVDPNGNLYFGNTETGLASWTRPE